MTTDTIDATLALSYNGSGNECTGYYSERWSRPDDWPCFNAAYGTIDGVPYCYICMRSYMGDHPKSTPIFFTNYRDNLGTPNALPAAPTVNIDHTSDSFTSLGTPTVAGREDAALLQTPNLIERWKDAVRKARAATSPIERREWLEHAISLTEMIIHPSICSCGVAYNALTKRCDECDERERLKQDRRAHIAGTERQRDEGVPF